MHSFMRAIGFEQLNNVQLEELLNKVVASHDYIHTATDSQGNEFVQYTMHIGESMGICACGSYLENGEFSMDYYYPFFWEAVSQAMNRLELKNMQIKNLTLQCAMI